MKLALKTETQGVHTRYLKVDKAMAFGWLEKSNNNNRAVRQERVAQYAKDMRDGVWRTTHQGIAFGADGTLYDGQHRLWAIVEADAEVTLAVTTGLGEEARGEIDMPSKRTVADNFRILTGVPNAKRMVEVANAIQIIVMGGHRGAGTFTETQAYLERYKPGVVWAAGLAPKLRIACASMRGALAFAHKTNPAKVEAFADQVWTGANLSAGSPAFVLRDLLLEGSGRNGGGADRRTLAVKALRAISYALAGQDMKGKLYATEDVVAFFGLAHDLQLKGSTESGLSSFVRRINGGRA